MIADQRWVTPSVCTGNLWPSPPHNKPHNNKSSRENLTTETYHQQPDIYQGPGKVHWMCFMFYKSSVTIVT